MLYLRKIEKESKTESNTCLGETYVYENRDLCKDWNHRLETVLDWMNDTAKSECFGLICDVDGRAIPLFHSSDNYIVTESGKTYTKL